MDATAVAEQPFFKKRNTKNIRKRSATPPPANSDSESGYTSTEDEGRRIKRRRKTALVTAASNTAPKTAREDLSTTKFYADRTAQILETSDATKQSNWFDEKSMLGTARVVAKKADSSNTPDTASEGTYKGSSSYQTFITKNPNAPTKQVGPVKAPTNIRTITVTDFAPDVCKDYKQTGR